MNGVSDSVNLELERIVDLEELITERKNLLNQLKQKWMANKHKVDLIPKEKIPRKTEWYVSTLESIEIVDNMIKESTASATSDLQLHLIN